MLARNVVLIPCALLSDQVSAIYNRVYFEREKRPMVWPMDWKSADDPDTINSIEYSQRYRTTSAYGSFSRPKCTLLYPAFCYTLRVATLLLTIWGR